MIKIGRNDPCPCGSGKKFKRCCLAMQQEAGRTPTPAAAPPSLTREIVLLQEGAAAGKELFKTLGVFIFFTTRERDAWVFEVSEMDAVQVAAAGAAEAVDLEENPQTLEINWTHRFNIEGKKLVLTSYADQEESTIPTVPTQQIQAAVKKIRARISPELLRSIHLDQEERGPADS